LEGFAPKDRAQRTEFGAMVLFMSKQVSPPKISSTQQKIKIGPKCHISPPCTKASDYIANPKISKSMPLPNWTWPMPFPNFGSYWNFSYSIISKLDSM